MKNTIKIIKNDKEYNTALKKIEILMEIDPRDGTKEKDELDLLALIISDYESKIVSFEKPDPIDALLFRMEQMNLKQRNLIPYIGSRSKVSEVLARKRPLTLSMIRALNTGLGIPADSLINESSASKIGSNIDWARFPVKSIFKKGWFQEKIKKIDEIKEDTIKSFFQPFIDEPACIELLRSSGQIRSAKKMDEYALVAWTTRILLKATKKKRGMKFNPNNLDKDKLNDLVKLSWFDEGPLLAIEFLQKFGLLVIIETHLPRTYLDGASIMTKSGPVIGMTIRNDRIDNFWFTLLHELAHVILHFSDTQNEFYDDLDVVEGLEKIESEADRFAKNVLIPNEKWETSPASKLPSPQAAQLLAKQLGIHPAIVAGRMRNHFKAYQLLSNLVGNGKIRPLFKDVNWG